MKYYNKIYKVINGLSTLSVELQRKGKSIFIRFVPNFGQKCGFYISENPLIQYLIEHNGNYNKKFTLYRSREIESNENLIALQRQADIIESLKHTIDDTDSELTTTEILTVKLRLLTKRVQELEKIANIEAFTKTGEEILEEKVSILEGEKEKVEKTLNIDPLEDREKSERIAEIRAKELMSNSLLQVPQVVTIQEGKNYISKYALENNIEYDRRGMTSVSAVRNKALTMGIEFVNLK